MAYDHREIEKKAQEKWAELDLYRATEDPEKEKKYVLDMFPYPSGEGLHVGHPKGYIATDIYSRNMRMRGFSVLHPMGWDAFGLPAENFALKNKTHPRKAVEENIANFKAQLAQLGLDYDWSREINTTDPAYYKWTQWIFLKLLEHNLAFQSSEPINWCPSCMTGLANEDLDGAVCERCGTPVVKKILPQWVLKITDYADRMLADLDTLNWPEHIKEAQRNWIGRSEGINFKEKVKDLGIEFEVYDSIPQTFLAQTFTVIAPEHHLVKELVVGTELEKPVMEFVERITKKKAANKFNIEQDMEGIFTGRYVDNPFGTGDLPIWIASFVLADYGTGIVNCSAHDERDFAFAKKYNIPLKIVLLPEEKELSEKVKNLEVFYREPNGILQAPHELQGLSWEESREKVIDYIVAKGYGRKAVHYKIRDWVFSRQRYWGEPIPIIHCEKCGIVPVPYEDLPILLPDVESYEPTGTGESPLASIAEWVNTTCPKCGEPAKRETNTMPQWAGSSWYHLRYMDPHNAEQLVSTKNEKYWAPVDVYVGGDHAVRHLIYARFWHKFLYDIGVVSTSEPFARLEFLGFILAEDGRKMSKRFGNVINPDDVVTEHGADAFRIYEMFMGPFENTTAWNAASIAGTSRFIERVWRMQEHVVDNPIPALNATLHETIRKVGNDIEAFKFNTAVSQMMILLNAIEKEGSIGKEQWTAFLRVLAPFAPHVTEELWERIGETGSIHLAAWPAYDEAMIATSEVEVTVQVNGKHRGSVTLATDATEADVLVEALKLPTVTAALGGKEPARVVYVPGRILNLVVPR